MENMTIETKSLEEFEEDDKIRPVNLTGALSSIMDIQASTVGDNPWTAEDVDKYATKDVIKEYRKIVEACRFFYRRDPLASTVINKIVEISVTELQLIQGKVSDNQFRVFESLLPDLQEFIEDCALEYLVSGLLIPEIDMVQMPKRELSLRGIKTYPSLYLPQALWVRDPGTVIINSPLISNKPTYYVEIPEELRHFILNKGRYPNGDEDKELYNELIRLYPDFIKAIRNGETKVPLKNKLITRRKYLADSPYPTPYLYSALESLRHKRNLRRMDYSIASRVISAIQLVKVGNDEYPLVADDDDQLELLRAQMRWRDSNNKDIERIFQLFTNHTVDIEWVFPDTGTLLDEKKYGNVNFDILHGLGLPRILTTGESDRTQTSDPDIAIASSTKTLDTIRRKLIKVVRSIIQDVAEENRFREAPEIRFAPMNLVAFQKFLEGLQYLYDTGNLSRTDLASLFGYDFQKQIEKRAVETKLLKDLGVPEFAPVPHSNSPTNDQEDTDKDNTDKEDTTNNEEKK